MINLNFQPNYECGIAQRAIRGEEVSGDRSVVRFDSEMALFVVIDGAGHGPEAAHASATAASILKAALNISSPVSLLSLCHGGMSSTRGAAISIASISSNLLMNWCGVGNVEVVLSRENGNGERKNETLLLRDGVVGYQFCQPRASTLALLQGDLLIFATDGIRSRFLENISLEDRCQPIADAILNLHGKDSDDALVLVIRIGKGCP